jgi:anaerobic ribonucleoside-triphosphate reductase activating protein
VEELNDNQGGRGSSNQVIYFLSFRHLPEAHLFSERQRNVEIHIRNQPALMVGVPPRYFSEAFEKSVDFRDNGK